MPQIKLAPEKNLDVRLISSFTGLKESACKRWFIANGYHEKKYATIEMYKDFGRLKGQSLQEIYEAVTESIEEFIFNS